MKYITRELFDALQPDSGVSEKRAERKWEAASLAQYVRYLEIKPKLPKAVRSFNKVSLHDGVVKNVSQQENIVQLEVDCSDCFWEPAGWVVLTFHGVKSAEGLNDIIDDDWLYDEVDLHPDAAFEYSVLLSQSEFTVVADHIEFTIYRNKKKKRVVKRLKPIKPVKAK